MRNAPILTVTCDKCGEEQAIQLWDLSHGQNGLSRAIIGIGMGWTVRGSRDFCRDCSVSTKVQDSP